MFVPNTSELPLSYTISGGSLANSDAKIFQFDFKNVDYEAQKSYTFTNSYTYSAQNVSWTVDIQGGSLNDKWNRHDSVAHPDRGFFFDGRYDFQQFTAAMPPTFAMNFWTRTEHGGTLFSTNGIYDDGDQHFVHCGIRGNRMEMGVSEGENMNWVHLKGKNKFGPRNPLIPESSIHAESKRKARVFYAQTDMDVITQDWQYLTYTFGDDNGSLVFNYYVDGVMVDTSVRKFVLSIFQDNAIYPTRNLIGA